MRDPMLDLLLFFWPVSALVNPTPPAKRPARKRAPPPRRPKSEATPSRRQPAPRVLEGGRAGMP